MTGSSVYELMCPSCNNTWDSYEVLSDCPICEDQGILIAKEYVDDTRKWLEL